MVFQSSLRKAKWRIWMIWRMALCEFWEIEFDPIQKPLIYWFLGILVLLMILALLKFWIVPFCSSGPKDHVPKPPIRHIPGFSTMPCTASYAWVSVCSKWANSLKFNEKSKLLFFLLGVSIRLVWKRTRPGRQPKRPDGEFTRHRKERRTGQCRIHSC